MDEPGISTVDGVLVTKGALTRRGVPNGPSKLARPGVVLHQLVGDSEEQGGPSKGGEDHDAKHEQTVEIHTRLFMLLRGSGDLVETKPTGLQCHDDHFMPTIATLRREAMHISVVHIQEQTGSA